MKNCLVMYESIHGQTAKIAKRIAERLRQEGHMVALQTPKTFNGRLDSFDAIIVGGPVRVQKYPKGLRKWVHAHSKTLSSKQTAFFSVCLGILQKENTKVQLAEMKIVEDFLNSAHWQPKLIEIFGGALAYTQYGWLTKKVLQYIAKQAGGSTDTSRDHEYTDWDQVDLFAAKFLQIAGLNKDSDFNHPSTLLRDIHIEE